MQANQSNNIVYYSFLVWNFSHHFSRKCRRSHTVNLQIRLLLRYSRDHVMSNDIFLLYNMEIYCTNMESCKDLYFVKSLFISLFVFFCLQLTKVTDKRSLFTIGSWVYINQQT